MARANLSLRAFAFVDRSDLFPLKQHGGRVQHFAYHPPAADLAFSRHHRAEPTAGAFLGAKNGAFYGLRRTGNFGGPGISPLVPSLPAKLALPFLVFAGRSGRGGGRDQSELFNLAHRSGRGCAAGHFRRACRDLAFLSMRKTPKKSLIYTKHREKLDY